MLYNDVDEEQDSSLSADNDIWIPGSKSNNKGLIQGGGSVASHPP